MNQAYVALAHDLNTDDCEWTVCTGPRALEQAQRQLAKWLGRDGKWVGNVRPVGEILP
jgi:hypothetical protein